MMDPHSHNPQMQYYNQQTDCNGLASHTSRPSYGLPILKNDSQSYYPHSHNPQMRYYNQQNDFKPYMAHCYPKSNTYQRDYTNDAHHMMQMAQVAQAPRRGRKPLNEKKKRRKRNRPGSHIKRAKTAYFFFLDVFRKNYCKEGDQIPKASEITKACGKQWGIMTELDKKPYAEKAAVDRARYESEMSVYRKIRDPDKPKKPPTAYFYFLTDFRAQMAGQKIEKGRRLTEICGEEWNKLTEEQKKPYLDRVAIEYKKYQERMEEYRRKKGMAPPPQSQSRAQPRPVPVPGPAVEQQMPTQMPTQVPMSMASYHNGKPGIVGGLPMPVPHAHDDDDEDDVEDDDEDDDEEM